MTVPTITWIHPHAPGAILTLLPGSTVDGVDLRILDLSDPFDIGLIEWAKFEAPQVGQDGMAYFGGVFSAGRDMVIPIWCQCGSLAKALDTINSLHSWFGNHSFGYLRSSRLDANGDPFIVQAKCYAMDRQGFVQRHVEAAPGVVGDGDVGQVLYVVRLCAPYPHLRVWVGEDEPVGEGQYPTNQTVTIQNNCPNEIGVQVVLEKAGGTIVSSTVTNETTGRYITVTDTMASPITIDWFRGDPDRFSVVRGSTSLVGVINVGAKLTLVPGTNVLRFSGAGSSPTYNWSVYVTEEYDSI